MNQRTAKQLRRASDAHIIGLLARLERVPTLGMLKRARRVARRRWLATPRPERAGLRRAVTRISVPAAQQAEAA